MSPPKGSMRRLVDELLADGEWHRLDDIIDTVLKQIDEDYLARLVKHHLSYRRSPLADPPADSLALHRGAVRRRLTNIVTRPSIEIRGRARTREIRAVSPPARLHRNVGEFRAKAIQLLQDGQWHPMKQVLSEIGRLVAPGRAHRVGTRRLRHPDAYSSMELIRAGQHYLAGATLRNMKNDLEYDGKPPNCNVRWVKPVKYNLEHEGD